MNTESKKCPMCAEQIPQAAVTCEYCGALFEVTSSGYCQNCHEVREANGNGQCKVCGNAVVDFRVESKYLDEPGTESAATHQPAIRKKDGKILPWGILAAVIVISGGMHCPLRLSL